MRRLKITDEKVKETLTSVKWVAVALLITLAILFLSETFTMQKQKKELGIKAVKCMYEFTEVGQLQFNMFDLQKITTEPVFNQLTIDNENRALFTYVKFKCDRTSVNVIKATSSYVLYSLKNDNVDSERKFIFMFDCDKTGKISYVREAEINDFITYAD